MVEVINPRHWVFHQVMVNYTLFKPSNHRWDGFYHLAVWIDLFFNPLNGVRFSENGNPEVKSLYPYNEREYVRHRTQYRYYCPINDKWAWSDDYPQVEEANPGRRWYWTNPARAFGVYIPILEHYQSFLEKENGWMDKNGKFNMPCLDQELSAEYLARLAWTLKVLPYVCRSGSDKFRNWWSDHYMFCESQGFQNYDSWYNAIKLFCNFVAKRVFNCETSELATYSKNVPNCQQLIDSRKVETNEQEVRL